MSVAAGSIPRAHHDLAQPWLHSRRWDLTFLIASIFLSLIPYSVFLLFGTQGSFDVKGTPAYDARVLVNNLVAILVGGPHMYATFTRTLMDPVFLRKRLPLIASTVVVPIAVFTMAILSYETYVWLLTGFFALAALHALYQVVWLTEAYNLKGSTALSLRRRLIDYGLVLTSLYPVATFKMVQGTFRIGPVTLKYHDLITRWLPALPGDNAVYGGRYWLSSLAFLAFFTFLALWIGKTILEVREGTLNLPKTLLISATVLLMFWTPAMSNMDTAFQGVNTWHSFQYLALTWWANRLRDQRSGRSVRFLHWVDAPARVRPWDRRNADGLQPAGLWPRLLADAKAFLRRWDRGTGWTAFYLVCMAMLPISGLLIYGSQVLWPDLGTRGPGADEVYSYMGILSVLLVHYVQDAILFTDVRAIVD